MKLSHSYKITFQFSIWDILKQMSKSPWSEDTNVVLKTLNLAKLTAFLVLSNSVNLSFLRVKN